MLILKIKILIILLNNVDTKNKNSYYFAKKI